MYPGDKGNVDSSNLAVGHPELVISSVANMSRICIPGLIEMDSLRQTQISGETGIALESFVDCGEAREKFLHISGDDGIRRQDITSLRDCFHPANNSRA